MTILVLGANGMLGSQLVRKLREVGLEVLSTSRLKTLNQGELLFDAETDDLGDCLQRWAIRPSYILNAVGVIKPRISESIRESVATAIAVNALFPYHLAEVAESLDCRVIQIATDCVYSGNSGQYPEDAPHDPLDAYGKSKSLGEVPSARVMHLRASIIGPEIGRSTSLWEWVRNQPRGADLSGYVNHLWNGVTTDAFSDVCVGIIKQNLFVDGKTHLVPADVVSKYELVRLIANQTGRFDLQINPISPSTAINRTLVTSRSEFNQLLWAATSFREIPAIAAMVSRVPLGG